MNADEWDDLLNDVHAELLEPNGTRDSRYKLAQELADLEQRLRNVEQIASRRGRAPNGTHV